MQHREQREAEPRSEEQQQRGAGVEKTVTMVAQVLCIRSSTRANSPRPLSYLGRAAGGDHGLALVAQLEHVKGLLLTHHVEGRLEGLDGLHDDGLVVHPLRFGEGQRALWWSW